MKLDLLSLVSHELRTPLSSILNALRMLKDEDLAMSALERGKFLDMAYRNAERLNSTLSQLLDLSRLVSGRLVCRFHETSLKQLVLAKTEHFRADAVKSGHKLRISGDLDLLPVILGDAPRLEKVVSSIFENALRFSPPGAQISLTVKTEVKSSGLPAGISAGKLGHHEFVVLELVNPIMVGTSLEPGPRDAVFKIFGQQEAILDRVHEGVGGSLAIGAEVLKQHGGALYAEVDEDKFRVWVVLPVLKSEEQLMKVLESRLYALRTEVGAISLMILEVEPRSVKPVHEALKSALFRASDTVYSLSERNQVAVLMDDCKKPDSSKIVRRLLKNLGAESAKFLSTAKVGLASSPEDGTEPEKILDFARGAFLPLTEF